MKELDAIEKRSSVEQFLKAKNTRETIDIACEVMAVDVPRLCKALRVAMEALQDSIDACDREKDYDDQAPDRITCPILSLKDYLKVNRVTASLDIKSILAGEKDV